MIAVVVESDLHAGVDIDSIRIVATPDRGSPASWSFPLAVGGEARARIGIVPDGDPGDGFVVEASGWLRTELRVKQGAHLQFQDGQRGLVRLFLGSVCLGVACRQGESCVAGTCTLDENVAPVEGYTPASTDAGAGDGGRDARVAITAESAAACAPIPGSRMLSDFEDGVATCPSCPLSYWSQAWDETGTPHVDDLVVDMMPLPRCDSHRSLRVAGGGITGWGYMVMVNVQGADQVPYDASLRHGVSLWARSSTGAIGARVMLATTETGTCPPGTLCGDNFSAVVPVASEWRHFKVPFAAMAQDGWGFQTPLLLEHATLVAIQLTHAVASAALQDSFELWLDDVALY